MFRIEADGQNGRELILSDKWGCSIRREAGSRPVPKAVYAPYAAFTAGRENLFCRIPEWKTDLPVSNPWERAGSSRFHSAKREEYATILQMNLKQPEISWSSSYLFSYRVCIIILILKSAFQEVFMRNQKNELKLLKCIEQDCTMSTAQLAAMCDMTEEEVKSEIEQLENDHVILGYKAIINWDDTIDETVTALIEVSVTPQRDKGFDRIAERIYQYEEVESMYLTSGGFDFTVLISGRTLREVAMFVAERLSPIEGVISTTTHFILKKYKEKHTIFKPQEEQKERPIFV